MFVALPLNADVKSRIESAVLGAKPLFEDARWVASVNYHLTLQFIGEVSESAVADIEDAISPIPGKFQSANIVFDRFDFFGKPLYPRVLFLRSTAAPSEIVKLERLANEIRAAVREWSKPGDKPFTPHLTVARFNRLGPGDSPSALNERTLKSLKNSPAGQHDAKSAATVFGGLSATMGRVVLYESLFEKSGVRYSEINSWNLAR